MSKGGGRLILLAAAAASAWLLVMAFKTIAPPGSPAPLTLAFYDPAPQMPPPETELWPVQIRQPHGPVGVPTGEADELGRPVMLSCASCHSVRQPDATVNGADALDEFHQGLTYQHGSLTCLSCHNAGDYDTLRLADGRSVEFSDVMMLCSQCHGPQRIDYDHGAHGGMNGFWDRTRGGRTRNGCTVCHDPHAPAYPKMRPTFKPIDRFLESHDAHANEVHDGQ